MAAKEGDCVVVVQLWGKPAAGSRRDELRGRVPMLVAANLRAGEIDRPAGCELLELRQFSPDRWACWEEHEHGKCKKDG